MHRVRIVSIVLLAACGGATPVPAHAPSDTGQAVAPRGTDPSWPEAVVRQWDPSGGPSGFVRDGSLLIAAGPRLCAIDAATGQVVATTEYAGGVSGYSRVVVSPDDTSVLAGDTRWSLLTGEVARFDAYDALDEAAVDELGDNYGGGAGIAAIPGMTRFFAQPLGDVLWLVDADGGVLMHPLDEGEEGGVDAIDPTGATFVIAAGDTLTLRAADDGAVIATQTERAIDSASYAPDGSAVLLPGEDAWQLLVPATGEVLASSARPIGNTRWTSAWLSPSGVWVLLATSTSLGVLDLRDRTLARAVPVAYDGLGGERDPSAAEDAVELTRVWPLGELGAVGVQLRDDEGTRGTMQLMTGPEVTPAAGEVQSDRTGTHRLTRGEHALTVRSGEAEASIPLSDELAAPVASVVFGPHGLALATLDAAIELRFDGTVTRSACYGARPRLAADGTVRWASGRQVCGADGTQHPLPGNGIGASRDGARLLVGGAMRALAVVDGATGAIVSTPSLPAGATPVEGGAAISPDGTRVAVATSRGVSVLDAGTGRALASTALAGAARVTFVGDASRVAVATREGALSVRDAATLRVRASLATTEDFSGPVEDPEADVFLRMSATADGSRLILEGPAVRIVEVGPRTLEEVYAVSDEFTEISDDHAWLRTSADVESGEVHSTIDGEVVYEGTGDFAAGSGVQAVCERQRLVVTASGEPRPYGSCDGTRGRLFVSDDGRFVLAMASPTWLGARLIRVADGLELRITILGESIALERSDGRVDAIGDRVLFLHRAAGPLVGATMTPVPRDPTLLADFFGATP